MTEAADSHPHRSPVVLVVAADERSAEVTIERQTRVVFGATPKETRNAALDLVADYAAHLGRSVLVNARDVNGAWQLIVSPTGVVRAAGGREVALMADRPRRGRAGRIAAVAAGGVVVLALLGGGGFAAVRYLPDALAGGPTAAPERPTVTMQARQAPPGFTEQARWRLPMRDGAQPDVSPEGDRVALVDVDGRLRVVGPDGETAWSADLPLPADEMTGPPRFVAAGDGQGVAVVGEGRLWVWPPGGGEPRAYELPEGAEVTFAGAGPLVMADGRPSIPSGGELAPVEKPEGSGALLSDGRRVLTAVVRGPWVWVAPDGTREEVEPAAPQGAGELDEVLTAGGDTLVASWRVPGADDRRVLALHDAADGTVRAAAEVPAGAAADDADWAHGEAVAVYGPVVFDLATGTGTVLEGFAPASAAGEVAFGDLDGAPVAVTADAAPIELEGDVARPWGLLDGRAVVVAGGDLYALLPE
ncbi:hypothetical protein ACFPZ0_24180 [Streptomonospora nanhaiensis]|uniref:Uncharacterized protein n=1 Tax=Streptomonospora nanhaiensis TaxID=1323731 RepID=A0A853BH81_9ACTN|nr:hypothetical protein [Streptomonospora nanhaiensis]MBV2366127.1 hypothetical protein [Streptomonospora nanhaiensis]MBX9391212.1 hypothetical protein [Streptomonospora nanhaiensis]NYI93896.1 hypothetical protein [Streptomonospora nanhaiensis]